MRNLILIAIGGALGSVARYIATYLIQKHYITNFPLGTLFVNILGSFIIGLLYGYAEEYRMLSPVYRLFFVTGFCGGFTTFSAFAVENFTFIQKQTFFIALSYILLSVILGIASVWVVLH